MKMNFLEQVDYFLVQGFTAKVAKRHSLAYIHKKIEEYGWGSKKRDENALAFWWAVAISKYRTN